MTNDKFWQGVEAFNRREFYECHDILEALWMEAAELDRNFYQGILQIAVGCYHLGNQNLRGAVILLAEGIRRLHSYQPSWQGLDLTKFLRESQQLLNMLQQIGYENKEESDRLLGDGEEIPLPILTTCQPLNLDDF